MNVLSIGNSFSQDAHAWLHQITEHLGDDFYFVNLYIGGCNLEHHWECFSSASTEYLFEENGHGIRNISIQEALSLADWDVITFQQASHDSGLYNTYQPFLSNLHAAVTAACPRAKVYIHQTWAYEEGSEHWAYGRYNNSQTQMHAAVMDAYGKAAVDIDANIIPVGEVMAYLRNNTAAFSATQNGIPLTRDGFHLSLTFGRYAAALTWYGVLTGKDVRNCTFAPWDENGVADKELLAIVNQAVWQVLESKKSR